MRGIAGWLETWSGGLTAFVLFVYLLAGSYAWTGFFREMATTRQRILWALSAPIVIPLWLPLWWCLSAKLGSFIKEHNR